MGTKTSKEEAPGYLAKPSGDCCLKGTVHEGQARGSWETIVEVETYIARPQYRRGCSAVQDLICRDFVYFTA